MKELIRHFGRLRLFAVVLTSLPLVVLPLLGVWWLWQSDFFWYWLAGLVVVGASGYGLHRVIAWRDQRADDKDAVTQPADHWPPSADGAWEAVETMVAQATPEEYPLSEGRRLWDLGRDTLETVARHYHPDRDKPLLELTVPHALLIIERASRELREQIATQIPLSHRLTLGGLSRAKEWQAYAKRLETLYRLGIGVVDPTTAVFREFRRDMGNRIFGYGSDQIQRWLLQEYVRKVGYYAIELYSGQLLLEEEDPASRPTAATRQSQRQVETEEKAAAEPLRILVAGRANAGKSSLINALFGELRAAEDLLADTTGEVTPYPLEREGLTQALILDTPGCDTGQFQSSALKEQVRHADLILWVTPAHRPDRQQEREQLDALRRWSSKDVSRRPAPLLVVMTHIDRLRPVREWSPPYNLQTPDSRKAEQIAAAAGAVVTDLALTPEQVVPVSLKEGAVYNVDDALWAAILSQQSEANRARFLRCVAARRQEENWTLLWKQLKGAGRLLLDSPLLRR